MTIECDFLKIYNDFYQKIIHYLSRIVGPNEAEDLAQEVFDKISRSLGGFKEKSKLSTWIYRIATNTAIDRLRSASYKKSLESTLLKDTCSFDNRSTGILVGPPAGDELLVRKEMSECINEYIDNLPLDYKTVIVLSELKGFSNKEIAEILDISLNNVKIRLHRARAKLKAALNEACDFYFTDQNILACNRKQVQILPKAPN